VNKELNSNDLRRLDAQAMQVLGKVATEFSFFTSVAEAKSNRASSQVSSSDAITTMLTEAVDRTQADGSLAESPERAADAFAAHIVWLSEAPLLPGRSYLLKVGAQTIGAMVTELKYRLGVDALEHLAAKELHSNEIAFVNFATAEPISFHPYEKNQLTGGFLLMDRHSKAIVAAGLIRFVLRRAANTHFQQFEVTKPARACLKGHKPALLWFTGLSGAGKSTIANNLEKKLHALGKHTFVLDGDNVRHGLNRDLGFTEADRVENIRRIAEVAKLFVEAGLITVVAFISPFRAEREMARELVGPGEFIDIYVDTPLEICEQRDPRDYIGKREAANCAILPAWIRHTSRQPILISFLMHSITAQPISPTASSILCNNAAC
jgi:bifunctional enzyme CysN/CysC